MTTYVALGDSFTSGLESGELRWPDQVAQALGPGVRYENLAWVGATSADVERDQLSRALELDPDLITLICGANDVLASVRPDADTYAERLGRMYARLRDEAPGALLLTATYPDISRFLDLRPRSRARVQRGMRRFNDAARAVAHRHKVALLEYFDDPASDDRDTYAADGFHPSPEGHRRAAAAFLRALGNRFRLTEAPA
jgi:lysophospholipase L1-like esterase